MSKYLGWEMAELFAGNTKEDLEELEELVSSVALVDKLIEILRADAELTG